VNLRLLRSPPSRRPVCPITVSGTTLIYTSGLRYRLKWHHARCLAEAIHEAMTECIQSAAAGFVVRRFASPRQHWRLVLDGRHFDLPEVEMTRAQAVYIGTMLARAPRLEVVGG
jgi:hypothetical protein